MCLLGRARAACRPKSNAPTASQRNVEGADTSAATRGSGDWRQDEEETRAKHHSSLASQASLSGRKESSSSVPVARRGWPWARADTGRSPWQNWQAAAAFFPALFYRSRVPFRAAFFSGPGSISVSLRHSAYKAHITSKHSRASKTAAQRIKADICGSALPPSRNE